MSTEPRATREMSPELDVRPEVVQWFHDSEEQCPHDYEREDWFCESMATHFLRAFDVAGPRLTERADGTFSFESEHFQRLHRAALRESGAPS